MRKRKYLKSIRELTFGSEGKAVYIAGKVTGLEYQEAALAFDNAAAYVELNGLIALNPMDFVDPSCSWEEAMKICLFFLTSADAIWMLPDWEDSKGATWEREIALKLGIPVLVGLNLDFSKIIKTDF